jgi:hypothetical protein
MSFEIEFLFFVSVSSSYFARTEMLEPVVSLYTWVCVSTGNCRTACVCTWKEHFEIDFF